MKYLLLLAIIMPTFTWTMEGAKPIIKMEHKEFTNLLKSQDRGARTFSHTIQIPESEKGTIFELSTKSGFHPKSIQLDLEKGTKSITITRNDTECFGQFDITNDNNQKLTEIYMVMNSD